MKLSLLLRRSNKPTVQYSAKILGRVIKEKARDSAFFYKHLIY